jgi:hypothetical protein
VEEGGTEAEAVLLGVSYGGVWMKSARTNGDIANTNVGDCGGSGESEVAGNECFCVGLRDQGR